VEAGKKEIVPEVRELLARTSFAPGRLHALWTLAGLGALESSDLERALKDPEPGIREHALRLSEGRLRDPAPLLPLVEDASLRVRVQLAWTLGEFKGPARMEALARLALGGGREPYLRVAILSSAGEEAAELLARAPGMPDEFRKDLSTVLGARLKKDEIAQVLTRAAEAGSEGAKVSALSGLAEGLKQRRQKNLDLPAARAPLARLGSEASPGVRKALASLSGLIRTMSEEELAGAVTHARTAALDESRPLGERIEAAGLLGSGAIAGVGPALRELLGPTQPEPLQIAALQSLDQLADPGVVRIVVDSWRRLTPAVREHALEVLTGRKDRLGPLLAAFEKEELSPDQLDVRRRAQLLSYPDPEIQEKAKRIFREPVMDPRLFEQFKGALDLRGDPDRGWVSFQKLCLVCHQARGQGRAVGPNLTIVRDNPPEQILKNILYPSLVVAPNFVQYVVETREGQVFNGIIVEASGASLTLRRGGAEDVKLLRKDIRNLASSQISLMPEELMKGMSLQDAADLLQFVREVK
ncbi:MAG TPA: hypothetical protein VEN81_16085, partial [Planctomycetota bacterium]|nr:hypothetical protein [Planctomycetota bacterium]